ncbi:hypothetical protein [Autumnicola musiva]|uniref:Uncharacterized protein n=1 Tax=Autumnicola musiva TaxID=3075589 RepID=A0ABU3D9Q7_9FLAO|nr:hypothetical protein [Zunongwangia sp. F117]MDT0678186.1 hypothetical protein [Zunongwangia sp. F117]
MEKHSKEEILAEKIVKNAGLEKPSADFSSKVLKAIAARQEVVHYKPLISPWALIVFTGVMLAAVAGLFWTTSDFSFEVDFKLINFVSIPKLEISGTMMYAIAFISLFFLEIPFLKRFLVKQYE